MPLSITHITLHNMPPLSDPQGSWRRSSAACSAWASGCFGVKFPPASSACVSFGIRTSDASDTSDTSVNDGGRFWGGPLGCSFPEHHGDTFTYFHIFSHCLSCELYKGIQRHSFCNPKLRNLATSLGFNCIFSSQVGTIIGFRPKNGDTAWYN